MVIGITGGIGAGKSRILEILKEEYGARVIQADEVARELEEPGRPGLAELVEAFGKSILDSRGCLDRPGFARLIYGDREALETANRIIHPMTWQAVKDQIRQDEAGLTVVEAALFDESSRSICQKLVFVDTSTENRIHRLMEGRGYSREKCLDIMKNQPGRDYFLKLSDAVLDNNGTIEDVRRQISGMMEEWNT